MTKYAYILLFILLMYGCALFEDKELNDLRSEASNLRERVKPLVAPYLITDADFKFDISFIPTISLIEQINTLPVDTRTTVGQSYNRTGYFYWVKYGCPIGGDKHAFIELEREDGLQIFLELNNFHATWDPNTGFNLSIDYPRFETNPTRMKWVLETCVGPSTGDIETVTCKASTPGQVSATAGFERSTASFIKYVIQQTSPKKVPVKCIADFGDLGQKTFDQEIEVDVEDEQEYTGFWDADGILKIGQPPFLERAYSYKINITELTNNQFGIEVKANAEIIWK
ncbi:MAG: hypothetical protein JAY94_04445 [Candidatus Thiodiazotropha endolucinida]|nr:hypothetical protein [Candidatus Thiodiazotropha taylori]MCW4316740.1 hypothetical protein [Candidatus Thiodiazotropha taylori]